MRKSAALNSVSMRSIEAAAIVGPISGPVLVGVHIDYRDNHKLFEIVDEDSIH